MRVVFMGTPDFAVSSLDAICHSSHEVVGVVTVPDRPTGRGLKMTSSAVKQYAEQHGLPILQPEKLRDPQFLEDLKAWQADIFVVVAFRMLPQCVWAMPPQGTFNLHASLLPQYRGAAPINWAIINGERETGVTTFMLNERIDEGRMLLQRRCDITDSDTAETLHDRLAEMGRSLVVETLDGIESHSLTPFSQPVVENPNLAPKIFKADCAIPWDKSGEEIYNFVRGLSPYPAATMSLISTTGAELSFKIYEVSFIQQNDAEKGMVDTDGKHYLRVGVSDGFINILSLQPNGKRRMTIEEFLRGYNVSNCILNK
ncbi:MAG: methionyl-tRNA formyltransferase [Bacteroidales bacterium]|nr:methionyl-tRNA formyltransferase [Bacteroidales bacterium]